MMVLSSRSPDCWTMKSILSSGIVFERSGFARIVCGTGAIGGDFSGCQGANHPGRAAEDKRTRLEYFALCQQRTCSDNTVFTDFDSVEQNRAHANERIIPYTSAMHNGAVAHCAARADHGRVAGVGMEDGPILNIRACAHPHGFGIAPQYGVEPYTAV